MLFVNNLSVAQNADSLVPTKYYYENGQVSSEGFLRQGKPDGYWKSYYRNGLLKTEGNRENYQLEGTWKFYNEEGVLYLTIDYDNNLKDGKSITYRGDKPYKVERFQEDKKNGNTEYFYPSGTIKKKVPFVAGREVGLGFEYDSLGHIITLLTYKAGVLVKNQEINRYDKVMKKKGIWMEFHSNGQIKNTGLYVDDLKHGYWKYFKPNANLIRIEKWVHGVLVEDADELAKIDMRREIDPNTGALKYYGGYRNGKKEGIHREYDNDGNVVDSKLYQQGILLAQGIYDEQGRKQKEWKYFYLTGELKEQGNYRNDKKVGTWKYFFIDGKTEQIGEYVNDLPEGIWRWYYPNGQLRLEEEYIDGFEDGLSTEYDEEGNTIAEGKFIEGFKDGKWVYTIANIKEEGKYFEGEKQGLWTKIYIDNNKPAFEGDYLNGLENGFHTTYYPNGQVHKRGKYSMGVKIGLWEIFAESGSLIVTIKYENGKEIEYNGKKISYGKRVDRQLEEENKADEIQQ